MSIDRISFNNSQYPTIGVEVELQVLSRETLNLTPGASDILLEFQHSENVKDELLKSIIEINSDICKNPDEVFSSLSKADFGSQPIPFIFDPSRAYLKSCPGL